MTTEKKAFRSKDLIVPVYLDTSALLDLVASIEDGFALVEKTSTKSTTNQETDRSIQGGVGITGALGSLLGLKLDALKTAKQTGASETANEAERLHTYGSLLHRFREFLLQENLLIYFEGDDAAWQTLEPSSFVELTGVFRPNPLAISLSTMDRLIQLADLANVSIQPAGQTSNKKHQEKTSQNQATSLKQYRSLIQGMISDLEPEGIRTFIVEPSGSGSYKSVATLFTKNLRDQSRTEITNKEFRVLGKVVQVLPKGSNIEIDLLSGTGIGGLGETMLEQVLSGFKQMQTSGMNLPELSTKIPAPALQIVPIAIYI